MGAADSNGGVLYTRDDLARLLIKIRRGEAGYKQAMKFLYDSRRLPPRTEAVDLGLSNLEEKRSS